MQLSYGVDQPLHAKHGVSCTDLQCMAMPNLLFEPSVHDGEVQHFPLRPCLRCLLVTFPDITLLPC